MSDIVARRDSVVRMDAKQKKEFINDYNGRLAEACDVCRNITGADKIAKFDSIMGYKQNEIEILKIREADLSQTPALKVKNDALETMWMARQLESVDVNMYVTDYPDDYIQKHVPVSYEAQPGTNLYTFRMSDEKSRWIEVGRHTNDAPYANLKVEEWHFPVVEVQGAYMYTYKMLQESYLAGLPLDPMMAQACRRGYEDIVNAKGWYGNYKENTSGRDTTVGLLFNEDTQHRASLNGAWFDGNGAAILTHEQMYADLVKLATQVKITSKGMYRTNKIMMPLEHEAFIKATPLVLGTLPLARTIFDFFKQNYPEIEIVGTTYLSADSFVEYGKNINPTSGTGPAVNCMVAFTNESSKLKYVLAQGYNQIPVQYVNWNFIYNANAYVSSIVAIRPISILVMSNV